MSISNFLFTGPQAEAEKALWIFDMMVSKHPEITLGGAWKQNYDTWLEWHGDRLDAVGSNYFMTSRLIPSEYYASGKARKELKEAILAGGSGQWIMVAGKGVREADPYGETSVTPAWRRTATHYGTTAPQIDWTAFNSTQWKDNAM